MSSRRFSSNAFFLSGSDNTLNIPMLEDEQDEISSSMDLETRICSICDIYKPPRSKHCYICHRCVARFDHHCPLIGNCIGIKNHRLFYWFLFFEVIALITAIYINIDAVQTVNFQNIKGISQYAMTAYLLIGFLIVIAFSIYVTLLWILHTFLILKNQTTYEFILFWRAKHGRSTEQRQKPLPRIYDKGICSNVYMFCIAPREPLLTKTGSPRAPQQLKK